MENMIRVLFGTNLIDQFDIDELLEDIDDIEDLDDEDEISYYYIP